MGWTIEFDEDAQKKLNKIGKVDSQRIRKFLRERLLGTDDPRLLGKALTGERYRNLWRYRVGDYRLICSLQDNKLVVLVIEIGHRREISR